jgi:chromosome segregation protein
MHVRALRLAGFKSFADTTALEFHAGVNVVVGPNGSGKSNIADALTWVLGSQAPSTLRGASMEDVIFAGSAARPGLGRAEVELTLDNSDRSLPLDLSEVTISRYADRSGASEYKINGAPCRLLDVAELLSDTGIGRSIHTVVGQGQLDAVLEARPEDRRAFIEEAAQIGKFRRRKDRSLRKIERVDDNLLRVRDMLSELKRVMRPLKRQAAAAAEYSGLVSEHRALRQRMAGTELGRLRRAGAAADPFAEEKRAALLGDELEGARARLASLAGERTELAAKAEETATLSHRMGRVVDRLEALGRLAEERAERLAARLAAETEEGYRERIRLLDEERARWEGEQRSLAEVAAGARAVAARGAEQADSAAAEVREADTRLARARADETVAAQGLVRAEGRAAAARATLGAAEARVAAVRERRDSSARELGGDRDSLAAAEREVEALQAELDRAVEASAAAESRLEEQRVEAERLRAALGTSHADQAAATARLRALEEVADLLADEAAIVRRLDPLLEEARARASSTAAGEEQASGLLAGAEAAYERLWEDVSGADRELERVRGLMAAAEDRLAAARRRREQREVEVATLDEELGRANDALAAAANAVGEERAALPEGRAALEEARAMRAEAEESLGALRRAHNERRHAATEAEMSARTAEERALAAELRREEAEAGIADAQRSLAGLEELRAALGARRRRVEEAGRVARRAAVRGGEWAAEAEERARAARLRAQETEQRIASLTERERQLTVQLEALTRRRNEAELVLAQTEARVEALTERAMEDWGLDEAALMMLEPLAEGDEAAVRTRVQELERALGRLGTVNPRATEEYEELRQREDFLASQIEDLEASKRDLLEVVKDVDATIEKVFTEAFEAVASEFTAVFGRLFPGGTGRLTLLEPDDLLASGVDVEARPAGKNVRKLSLLSGGERSLVALAFLFAIFRSRPSPFYLLDEVDAALDDLNLQRFLTLIRELEQRAQVLIVSHQRRTMEAADVLYGVTMAGDGVSSVVATRLEELVS